MGSRTGHSRAGSVGATRTHFEHPRQQLPNERKLPLPPSTDGAQVGQFKFDLDTLKNLLLLNQVLTSWKRFR
ncbi:hypothetical protein AT864_02566 [Anoxybacillus sp. P3H1B]|nr:hypothetical protein AT864_02566 [Anoxybacillus sp. P3H1B]